MTDRTCPLGDDCDLTVAWMAGAEQSRATIRALRADIARAVRAAYEDAAKVADSIALPMDGKREKAQAGYMRDAIASHIRARAAEVSDDPPHDQAATLRADIAKLAKALRIMGVDPAKVLGEGEK